MKALLDIPGPRYPLARPAIPSSCTIFEPPEMFENELLREIPLPTRIAERLMPFGPAHPLHNSEEDITLYEFRAALDTSRRRSLPEEDCITSKARRNLDPSLRRSFFVYTSCSGKQESSHYHAVPPLCARF